MSSSRGSSIARLAFSASARAQSQHDRLEEQPISLAPDVLAGKVSGAEKLA